MSCPVHDPGVLACSEADGTAKAIRYLVERAPAALLHPQVTPLLRKFMKPRQYSGSTRAAWLAGHSGGRKTMVHRPSSREGLRRRARFA